MFTLDSNKAENVKLKRGTVGYSPNGGKQMYMAVPQNKYYENIQGLLFVVIPDISVVFPTSVAKT